MVKGNPSTHICEYSLVVKLLPSKQIMGVRFSLFALVPKGVVIHNGLILHTPRETDQWLCSSKEEHLSVEQEVAVSGSVKVAITHNSVL